MSRALLGRKSSLASRAVVYETPDGLEVETREEYEVTRQRVLFDDVLLVTYHRQLGTAFVIVHVLIAAVFLILAAVSAGNEVLTLVWLAFATPSLIALAIRILYRVDVVTVFGRRSRAQMCFAMRKRRAREVYGHICARVRQAHRRMEHEAAEERPPETAEQ